MAEYNVEQDMIGYRGGVGSEIADKILKSPHIKTNFLKKVNNPDEYWPTVISQAQKVISDMPGLGKPEDVYRLINEKAGELKEQIDQIINNEIKDTDPALLRDTLFYLKEDYNAMIKTLPKENKQHEPIKDVKLEIQGSEEKLEDVVKKQKPEDVIKKFNLIHLSNKAHTPLSTEYTGLIAYKVLLELKKHDGVFRKVSPYTVTVLNTGDIQLIDNKSESVNYKSEQQIAGDEVDERTDIQSLGRTMFYLLTKQNLFESDKENEYEEKKELEKKITKGVSDSYIRYALTDKNSKAPIAGELFEIVSKMINTGKVRKGRSIPLSKEKGYTSINQALKDIRKHIGRYNPKYADLREPRHPAVIFSSVTRGIRHLLGKIEPEAAKDTRWVYRT